MITQVDFDLEGRVYGFIKAQKCLEEAEFIKYIGKFSLVDQVPICYRHE